MILRVVNFVFFIKFLFKIVIFLEMSKKILKSINWILLLILLEEKMFFTGKKLHEF
jgi:hypothetical protein